MRKSQTFGDAVREIVQAIPVGNVCTYGGIAEMLDRKASSAGLAVARAMGDPGNADGWHRVVRANGTVSPKLPASDREEQRRLLQCDGVEINGWRVSGFKGRLWKGR